MLKPIRLTTENFMLVLLLSFTALMGFWDARNWVAEPYETQLFERINGGSLSHFIGYYRSSEHVAPLYLYFLYYWHELVGNNIFWMRLPSVFFAIIGVWTYVRVLKRWFSAHTALMSGLLLVGLTLSVSAYTNTAVFSLATLLLFWTFARWTSMVKKEERIPFLNYLGLGTALALTFLTHYEMGLVGLILYLSGFFLIDKNQVKPYFITLLFAFVLVGLFFPYLVDQWQLDWAFNFVPLGWSALQLGALVNWNWVLLVTLLISAVIRVIVYRKSPLRFGVIWPLILGIFIGISSRWIPFDNMNVGFGVIPKLLIFPFFAVVIAELIAIPNEKWLLLQLLSIGALLFFMTQFPTWFSNFAIPL